VVLRTRTSQLCAERDVAEVARLAQDETERETLNELKPHALIAVPVPGRDRVLGVATFVSARSRRAYDADDLHLAEELGVRLGLCLDNARLHRTREQAIHARDDALGIVAHDLRNLLTTVAGRTQVMLRKRSVDRHLCDDLLRIGRAVTRMDELLGDLLDVTRMEAGHVAQARRAFAVDDLVDEAIDAARQLAHSKNLRFDVFVEGGLKRVFVDPSRIHQVLTNLLGNAIKFTPSGGAIQLRAVRADRSVRFTVSDTGPGIGPDQLPRVFDRFWQANQADRRGAGLGLAICKWIVEAHGGSITVDSQVGVGSDFRFTVPLADAEDAERPALSFCEAQAALQARIAG
jgi:signal transduction histidine kinase